MTRPVTSTSVATNGADEAAGSKPNRRNPKGSTEPIKVPQRTMPTNESPTVKATRNQCGPYILVKIDQSATRRNPIAPRIEPRASPVNTSRYTTRHQSLNLTSPIARARITRVEAWEPELPPLEIINGTNSAKTTARWISFSKNPMADAVNISPINRMTSHPARFLTMRVRAIWRYGSSRAAEPPIF